MLTHLVKICRRLTALSLVYTRNDRAGLTAWINTSHTTGCQRLGCFVGLVVCLIVCLLLGFEGSCLFLFILFVYSSELLSVVTSKELFRFGPQQR